MDPDHLARLRRVGGTDLRGRLQQLAADDQVILAAQFRLHLGQRFFHRAAVLVLAEIGERLVAERPLREGADVASTDAGGFYGGHGGMLLARGWVTLEPFILTGRLRGSEAAGAGRDAESFRAITPGLSAHFGYPARDLAGTIASLWGRRET